MEYAPAGKTLENYDFAFQPALTKKLVFQLAAGHFIDKRENIILMGQPGTGKTHLASAIAQKALLKGRKVALVTAADILLIILNYSASKRLRNKINDITKTCPAFSTPQTMEMVSPHIDKWKQLQSRVNPKWCLFYSSVSRIADVNYIPEDIYYLVVEKRLNDSRYSWVVADKNFYDVRYNFDNNFIKSQLKNIAGTFIGPHNNIITYSQAENAFNNIRKPFVIKPSIDSGGGKNVNKVEYNNAMHLMNKKPVTFADLVSQYQENFLLQDILVQADFYAKFNPSSVNTLRLFTYRSIKSEEIMVLKAVLRMGRKGMFVDNQRSGGISVGVNPADGTLSDYSVDKYGFTSYSHPDSGITFKGDKVDNLRSIIKVVENIAKKIPSQRLLSFDIIEDHLDGIKIIEINTIGQEINFLQLFRGSLFGEYTDEIIEYCSGKHDKSNQGIREFIGAAKLARNRLKL